MTPSTAEAMSRASVPTTRNIVAVMGRPRSDGAALQAEPVDEAEADIAVAAMALDHGELEDVLDRYRAAIPHRPREGPPPAAR